jgi:hypothetical protein
MKPGRFTMRTQLGSEVINQDRRQLLSTATMGIAAAAAASLFPRIRRPLRRVTRSAPSASIFRMKTSQIFTDACWRHAGPTRTLSRRVGHRGRARRLVDRGIDVSEVFHRADRQVRLSGPDPARRSYGSFVSFSDPDGNGWLIQEVTTRLPGRV